MFTKKGVFQVMVSAAAVCVIAGAVVVGVSRGTSATPSGNASATSFDVPPVETLSPAEVKGFEATSAMLEHLVKTEDPAAAFGTLKKMVADTPKLSIQCHALTHAIGDAAYEKYGNFKEAFVYNDYMCGSGYVHSLIVNAIQASKDPATVIRSICDGQDGYCYHGIGHGLMFFTENDVPRALGYCAALDTSEHQQRCSEGVFMQNFEAGQDDPTPYVYATDPLKLCRDELHFKTACYLYAGEYLSVDGGKHPDMFALCDLAEKNYVNGCVTGMGVYLMAMHLDDPSQAIQACDAGKTEGTIHACIDGVVSYDLANYNSLSKTTAFCATLGEGDGAACNASVAARKRYYL